MGLVLFADQYATSGIEDLPSGAIRVRGRVSRTGVQEYAPWPGAPVQDRMIRVYRPASEVFADSSLSTLRSIPVTIGHPPPKEVTARTWKKYAVGHVEGHDIVKADEGDQYVETSLVVSDADAIERVRSKELREISQGYYVQLDWTPGTAPDGTPYDAIQRQIVHNHTALLRAGDARAGAGARVLLDSTHEEAMMTEEQMKALLDAALKPLADRLDKIEADAKVKDKTSKSDEEEEKEEGEEEEEPKADKGKKTGDADDRVAKLERELGALQAKALLSDNADAVLSAVLDARDEARDMLPADYSWKGKSPKQIKLDAIRHCAPKLFEAFGEDASEERISGAFDALKGAGTRYVPEKSKLADSRKAERAHIEEHQKRMNDAFVGGGE